MQFPEGLENTPFTCNIGMCNSRLFHYLTNFFSLYLRHISDEECYIIGMDPKYARPDWMIVTALPGNSCGVAVHTG